MQTDSERASTNVTKSRQLHVQNLEVRNIKSYVKTGLGIQG